MNSQIKYFIAFFVIVTGGLVCPENTMAAKPAEVTVTDANPESGPQGTALDVVISGTGFGKGSTVRFLLGDTEDDSQVEIIGEVTYDKVSGDLTAPIFILNAAETSGYNIEVTTTSGRRGKGTDLFKVENNTDPLSRTEQGGKECNDGIDNDGDGKTDGEDDDCFGSFKPNRDGSGRGKDLPLIAILDPNSAGRTLQHDDLGPVYVHGEMHVKALAGDPRLRRIEVQTGGNGKNVRQVSVSVRCEEIPPSFIDGFNVAVDRCDELGANGVFDFTGGYIFSVIPYLVNCPNNTPPDTSPCHDVFTMGAGDEAGVQLMSFKLYSGVEPTIEAASDIGGSSIVDPGNCLSLLTEAQRTAFLLNNCTTDPADCNVSVAAEDIDADGENDDWMIDGVGIKALICSLGPQTDIVYGQTILDIGFHTFKK
jgi:hypothetical protein